MYIVQLLSQRLKVNLDAYNKQRTFQIATVFCILLLNIRIFFREGLRVYGKLRVLR